MDDSNLNTAGQIARVVAEFEEHRTGHAPQSMTVVLSDDTLVITMRGVLSAAERDLARTPEGAAQVREYHRQLLGSVSDTLRREIERVTGVAVQEATEEIETTTGAAVAVFATGAVVQVFRLADRVPLETWTDVPPDQPPSEKR